MIRIAVPLRKLGKGLLMPDHCCQGLGLSIFDDPLRVVLTLPPPFTVEHFPKVPRQLAMISKLVENMEKASVALFVPSDGGTQSGCCFAVDVGSRTQPTYKGSATLTSRCSEAPR